MQTAENDRVEAKGGEGTPKTQLFVVASGVPSMAGTNIIGPGAGSGSGCEASAG